MSLLQIKDPKSDAQSKQRFVVGIDFGTTNSLVCKYTNNVFQHYDLDGDDLILSSITITPKHEKIIGSALKDKDASYYIPSIKRFIGVDEQQLDYLKQYNHKFTKKDNMLALKVFDKDYSVVDLSALIFDFLKNLAEKKENQTLEAAVITVPAYFNDSQRQAVKNAALLANIDVLRLINEPTAAAIAYGLESNSIGKYIIYDLGGGTFDVSILSLEKGIFKVLSTDGNTMLGGDDIDFIIAHWIKNNYAHLNDLDIATLKDHAKSIKEKFKESTTEINYTIDGHDITLSKQLFKDLIMPIIDKTIQTVISALDESGLDRSDIDSFILVGGSTRIPAIQDIVKKFFGKDPSKGVNPDEVVAVGAAIQGGVLTGDVTDVLLLDVTPLSLGIETMGGVMTKLIESNTTIPSKKSQVFSTAADNQPSVEIHVLQGERSMAKDNKTIGRFHLDGIPPSPRGVPQIEVTFDIDANGIIQVTALDKATNKSQDIRIEASSGLTEEEIEKMKKEAEANADSDKKLKEEADTLNSADTMIFQTESQLKEFGEKLSDEKKKPIEEALEALKKSYESKNLDSIKTDLEKINEAWKNASEELYKAQAESSKNDDASSGNEKANKKDGEDDVQDVDFEEVK